MTTSIPRHSVNLTELHPAAGDPIAATGVLRDAVERCDEALAPGASLHLIVEVLELVLGAPLSLRSASWVIARTAEPDEALRYEAAVGEVGHALDDKIDLLLLRFFRALAFARPAEISALKVAPLAARAKRLAAHLPDERAQRWLSLSLRSGIEASVAAHHALLWEQPYGVVDDGNQKRVVSQQSARALMQEPSPSVRRQAAHVTARYALQRASVLEPLKRGRLTCARDIARALGHRDAYEQILVDSGLTQGAVDALLRQREPILELTGKYYAWKRRGLRLDDLREVDLTARACRAKVDLSFERLIACVRSFARSLDPDYPDILTELLERRCILTSPEATRSAEWVCVTNLGGGLPFVHTPYRDDYESFVAAAHELGHAFQLTASARRVGALSLYTAPSWFAETFSLRAEIDAVHASLERSASPLERAFWAEAAIDQWLYFVRTLQIAGRFDLVLHRQPEQSRSALSAALEQIRRELSPSMVQSAIDGEDASWLLQTHSERSPCMGLQYGLAMLMAYRSRIDGVSLRELSDHGASLRIDDACARYLKLDVADPDTFAPIWRHMDELFTVLLDASL